MSRKPDPLNSEKCWKEYFRSEAFAEDNDGQWEDEEWILEFSVADPLNDIVELGFSRTFYVYCYLKEVAKGNLPENSELLQMLIPLKDEVVKENDLITSDSADKTVIHNCIERTLSPSPL